MDLTFLIAQNILKILSEHVFLLQYLNNPHQLKLCFEITTHLLLTESDMISYIIISGPLSSFFSSIAAMLLMSLTSVVYFGNWVFLPPSEPYLLLARHKVPLHYSLLHLYYNNKPVTLVHCIALDSREDVGETN